MPRQPLPLLFSRTRAVALDSRATCRVDLVDEVVAVDNHCGASSGYGDVGFAVYAFASGGVGVEVERTTADFDAVVGFDGISCRTADVDNISGTNNQVVVGGDAVAVVRFDGEHATAAEDDLTFAEHGAFKVFADDGLCRCAAREGVVATLGEH